MLTEFLPFTIEVDPTAIAGMTLWSLALYLGLFPVSEWIAVQLTRWFNFAEQSLYTSQAEFERTRKAREAQNTFYASLFSIIPFLLTGALLGFGIDRSLGQSWTISLGIMACMICGLYELGRRDGQQSD
jgi:hypothetical protein